MWNLESVTVVVNNGEVQLQALEDRDNLWLSTHTRTIQQTARNCAEQFLLLSPGEKCESKKGVVEILSFSF
jgi:hypothetical protein